MAHFKLSLIVPNNDNNDIKQNETYLSTTITDYNDQRTVYDNRNTVFNDAKYTIAYTYNEKLSMHKNGQQELSFSVDDKVFANDEWIENPFARILRNGIQIELQDKYKNRKLFTVNKIAYSFHNVSITYNITCQDSFTYQLNRQNNGYVLTNDETSADFIGALDIDEWASKIAHDCYLTYEYIPLDTGIYLDKNGIIRKFEVPGDDVENPVVLDNIQENVEKIIKPIYNKDNYAEYYETFPFSASGSSANAALISAAETLGLQLKVVEGLAEYDSSLPGNPIRYIRYFFFAPSKNPEASGLTYSPLREIQDFGLSFSGDSLTTVLNVNSTTWEDQEIGLIPTVPAFFNSLFMDPEWNSSNYYSGFFLEAVKGKSYGANGNFNKFFNTGGSIWCEHLNIGGHEGFWAVPFNTNIFSEDSFSFWPTYYNRIKFYWDDKEHYTNIGNANSFQSNDIFRVGYSKIIGPTKFNFFEVFHNTQAQWEDYTFIMQTGLEMDLNSFIQLTNWNPSSLVDQYTVVLNGMKYILNAYVAENTIRVYGRNSLSIGYLSPTTLKTILEECFTSSQLPWYWLQSNITISDAVTYEQNEEILKSDLEDFNQNHTQWYLFVPAESGGVPLDFSGNCYFQLTRNYTQEEIDFATIAEECPWLENKIMDFSYFVRQGILSGQEYENLMNYILNDLRIINGQLICYASAYFDALHKQVKTLAEIQQSLDTLGASFYSDIVEPYTASGEMSKNITNFTNHYNTTFNHNQSAKQKTLMNLDNIVSDTFNKYFAAEQRFLKNMYDFRKYFDSTNIYSLHNDTILEDVNYTVSIANSGDYSHLLVGFTNKPKWDRLVDESPIIIKPNASAQTRPNKGAYTDVDLYQYHNHQYIKSKIPSESTWKEFYVPEVKEGSITPVEASGHKYNATNSYYYKATAYPTRFGRSVPEARRCTFGTVDYVRLTYKEVIQLFVYQQTADNEDHEPLFYLRDTDLKVPFEWVRTNLSTITDAMKPQCWPGLSILSAWNPDLDFNNITDAANETILNEGWVLYKTMMPVSQLFIKDYNISYTTNTEDEIEKWLIYDENNKPYKYDETAQDWIKTDNDGNETHVTTGNLYKKFYSVPLLSYYDQMRTVLTSLGNDSSANNNLLSFMMEILSATTNSQYYTCNIDAAKKGWSIAASCVFFPFLAPFIIHDSFAYWGQRDGTYYSLSTYKVDNDKWSDHHKNSGRAGDLGNESYSHGDSHWVNYVLSQNSEEEIKNLTEKLWTSTTTPNLFSLLDNNDKDKYKHYFNYYKNIVATYSQGAPEHVTADLTDNYTSDYSSVYQGTVPPSVTFDPYWINNNYARICSTTESFNPDDEYVWIERDTRFKLENGVPKVGLRFSTLKFYSLVANTSKVNILEIYDYNYVRKNKPTWVNFMAATQAKYSNLTIDCDGYNVTVTNTDWPSDARTKVYYIVHLEPFEKIKLSDQTVAMNVINPHSWVKKYYDADSTVYFLNGDRPVKDTDIILKPDGSNFMYIPAKDNRLIKAKFSDIYDWTNTSIHWYETNDTDKRTYTIEQILLNNEQAQTDSELLKFYYLSNQSWATSELSRKQVVHSIKLPLTFMTYHYTTDNELIIDKDTISTELTVEFNSSAEPSWSKTLSVNLKNKPITVTVVRDCIQSYDVGQLSNGEFWYNFHDRLDIVDLNEKTAVIEAQLMLYWNEAYTASQYCQWFIPEYWQDTKETSQNFWAPFIWNTQDNHLRLNPQIVPYVEIYRDKNETVFDNFNFFYHSENTPCNKEEYEINELPVLRDNPAITNAIDYVFKDVLNQGDSTQSIDSARYARFTAQKYSRRTYYYRTGGGLLRSKVLSFLDPTAVNYPLYNGLYCMQLNLLVSRYRNAEMPIYKQKLDEKLNLWKNLYIRYPGIFLENTYSNENARSSLQLLQMAKLAFKDYTSPEKQYNITLIDAAALDGYQGQELDIGDSILIRTADYYDAVDETYRALNQYLFISDISYSLRQDTNISLTVNTIKYQDKLLQSLVKLIR